MNRLRLILADTDADSQVRHIWQQACDDAGYRLEILTPDDADARKLRERLSLNLYPALIQGERIVAVGSPDAETARNILAHIASGDKNLGDSRK